MAVCALRLSKGSLERTSGCAGCALRSLSKGSHRLAECALSLAQVSTAVLVLSVLKYQAAHPARAETLSNGLAAWALRLSNGASECTNGYPGCALLRPPNGSAHRTAACAASQSTAQPDHIPVRLLSLFKCPATRPAAACARSLAQVSRAVRILSLAQV